MKNLRYRELALQWQPDARSDSWFRAFAMLFIGSVVGLGFWMSRIELPVESRDNVRAPERVARFITQSRDMERPEPVVSEPEPPPKPAPRPKIQPPVATKPAPEVRRPRPEVDEKRLTDQQRQAREKATNSGLLTQMQALNELTDTGDLAEQLSGPMTGGASSRAAASKPRLREAAQDSGGVDQTRHAATAGDSKLAEREIVEVQEVLAANAQVVAETVEDTSIGGSDTRTQEEITLVVDRHKGQLQALYNRARRVKPSLRGTLVVALTIAPDGTVTRAEIVSSELGDSRLEASLLGRLKALRFEPRDVPSITVSYPIEFLP